MNEAKAMRLMLLGHAEEMGILDKVKQHEARLAGRFIQQPTEEDLAAYGMAIAIVAARVEELMANSLPQIKMGEYDVPPIEVTLQPTEEQINTGILELYLNGVDLAADSVTDSPQDVITFVWQAMIGARDK